MLLETHMLGELYATRQLRENPKYTLVISHGFAGHSGIYDAFCTYIRGKKVRTSGFTMLRAVENRHAVLGHAVSLSLLSGQNRVWRLPQW
ncbi:MAG: hypothetical protein AAGG02_18315 [Cyanobacteria bacterium P01_H01_bin.15]